MVGIETVNGTAGNDSIAGDAGKNTLDGGDGNDTLNGREGNNVIRCGSGDDIVLVSLAATETIFGGYGTDVVQFTTVSRGQMTVNRITDGWEVSGGGLGTRTLFGVERLQFSDTSVYL